MKLCTAVGESKLRVVIFFPFRSPVSGIDFMWDFGRNTETDSLPGASLF